MLDGSVGYIDLFWPGTLLVEQKSAGRSLEIAREQAGVYFDALPEHERPRYQLLSDFQTFELLDRAERKEWRFSLAELPNYVEVFGFMVGLQKHPPRDQDPVNIEAAERMGALHDALEAAGYTGHDLERFLVRTVFCLFAENTGIFERDSFLNLLEHRTSVDGADTGARLTQLFQVLDTPEDARMANLDKDLARFPYVNGDLFREQLRIPQFDGRMREALIEACNFNWSQVSPAIFGSLFQSVMAPKEQRVLGAHYTTEENILKVIKPLFLDGLRAEFERLQTRRDTRRRADLEGFHKRLSEMTFFDPACGCGNFLIIAYCELRRLEIKVIRELIRLRDEAGQLRLDVTDLTRVNVDQFYGIEISEFPARIAETALWMMDHIMNNELSLEFGENYARIPLTTAPHIRHADALETNWAEVLPPERCSYVLGNPPFGGFVFRAESGQQSTGQLMKALGAGGARLDYVAAWFLKAGAYFQGLPARIGFVATSSLTQGEQVAQLWPALFERYGLEIAFAHDSFVWSSDARNKAHVHVVIIGLSDRRSAPNRRRLFIYGDDGNAYESSVRAISPYLIDATGLTDPHTVVHRHRSSLSGLPLIRVGTKPVDGGHYLFDREERLAFLEREPRAEDLLRPFLGASEFIRGTERWILHVSNASPAQLRQLPAVMERVRAVRSYRTEEAGALGRSLAETPTAYHVTVVPKQEFLAIPETSSERREYVPIGWLQPPTIPSNALLVAEGARLWQFALLTSTMHVAWLRYFGGRLKSDFRYSSGLVYNPFPLPPAEEEALRGLEPLAQAVLDARAAHPHSTLADLYDPITMPPNLRRAHQELDRAVDRLYRRSGFATERERVEHLLGLYEQLVAPLAATAKPKRRRRRRRG